MPTPQKERLERRRAPHGGARMTHALPWRALQIRKQPWLPSPYPHPSWNPPTITRNRRARSSRRMTATLPSPTFRPPSAHVSGQIFVMCLILSARGLRRRLLRSTLFFTRDRNHPSGLWEIFLAIRFLRRLASRRTLARITL